jgi:hypothetical protein
MIIWRPVPDSDRRSASATLRHPRRGAPDFR